MNNAQTLRNWGPVIANVMWSDFLEFQDVTGLMPEQLRIGKLDEFMFCLLLQEFPSQSGDNDPSTLITSSFSI
jgi:hypothetical protein